MTSKDSPIETSELLNIMAHQVRLGILKLLWERPRTFSDLMKELYLESTSKLSFHLNKMEKLVEKRENGVYELTDLGFEAYNIIQAYENNELTLPNKVREEKEDENIRDKNTQLDSASQNNHKQEKTNALTVFTVFTIVLLIINYVLLAVLLGLIGINRYFFYFLPLIPVIVIYLFIESSFRLKVDYPLIIVSSIVFTTILLFHTIQYLTPYYLLSVIAILLFFGENINNTQNNTTHYPDNLSIIIIIGIYFVLTLLIIEVRKQLNHTEYNSEENAFYTFSNSMKSFIVTQEGLIVLVLIIFILFSYGTLFMLFIFNRPTDVGICCQSMPGVYAITPQVIPAILGAYLLKSLDLIDLKDWILKVFIILIFAALVPILQLYYIFLASQQLFGSNITYNTQLFLEVNLITTIIIFIGTIIAIIGYYRFISKAYTDNKEDRLKRWNARKTNTFLQIVAIVLVLNGYLVFYNNNMGILIQSGI